MSLTFLISPLLLYCSFCSVILAKSFTVSVKDKELLLDLRENQKSIISFLLVRTQTKVKAYLQSFNSSWKQALVQKIATESPSAPHTRCHVCDRNALAF